MAKGGVSFRFLKIKGQNFISYKKHSRTLMMKLFGKTNAAVKLVFPTADTTAKVFASLLIHRNKPRLIFHTGTLREE